MIEDADRSRLKIESRAQLWSSRHFVEWVHGRVNLTLLDTGIAGMFGRAFSLPTGMEWIAVFAVARLERMAAAGLQANEAWPAVANHFGSLTVGDFLLQKKTDKPYLLIRILLSQVFRFDSQQICNPCFLRYQRSCSVDAKSLACKVTYNTVAGRLWEPEILSDMMKSPILGASNDANVW